MTLKCTNSQFNFNDWIMTCSPASLQKIYKNICAKYDKTDIDIWFWVGNTTGSYSS